MKFLEKQWGIQIKYRHNSYLYKFDCLFFFSIHLSKYLVILTPEAGVIDKLNRLGHTLNVDMDMLKIFAIRLLV